jgi:hypothetical protein
MKPNTAFEIIKKCISYKSQFGRFPDPNCAKEHMQILQAFRFVRVSPKIHVSDVPSLKRK